MIQLTVKLTLPVSRKIKCDINANTYITSQKYLVTLKNFYFSSWFGLVWFYGTSTIVGYLMPNPFLYI